MWTYIINGTQIVFGVLHTTVGGLRFFIALQQMPIERPQLMPETWYVSLEEQQISVEGSRVSVEEPRMVFEGQQENRDHPKLLLEAWAIFFKKIYMGKECITIITIQLNMNIDH